jgi:hypothetical protein
MVHKGKDQIVAIRRGKLNNKVHGYHQKGPRIELWCYRLKRWFIRVSYHFTLLTPCTSFDVGLGEPLHFWPPVVLTQ